MPSVSTIDDAAYLSGQVYNEIQPNDGQLDRGWRLLNRQEMRMADAAFDQYFSGNYLFSNMNGVSLGGAGSQAFIAEKNGQLALVFRGTDPNADWALNVTLPFLDAVYDSFAPILAAFERLSSGPSLDYVFGHSLGGYLSETYMANHRSSNLSAITFGSPGSAVSGPVDTRITNISHTQDPVVHVLGLGLAPSGVVLDIDLAAYTAVTADYEHTLGVYSYTTALIEASGLFPYRTVQPVYVLGGSDDTLSLTAATSGRFVLGDGGSDRLTGSAFRDLLSGDGGYDTITGGGGADVLSGGSGRDDFVLLSGDLTRAQSGVRDTIVDYNQGNRWNGSTRSYSALEGDVIDLSTLAFASTTSGYGDETTVRVRMTATGAVLEVNPSGTQWVALANLRGLSVGDNVSVLLTPTQQLFRTGTVLTVVPDGGARTWTVSPASESVAEGTTTLTFTITRTNDTATETVFVSTWQGHGSYNDRDYTGFVDREITFLTGVKTQTVSVSILQDSLVEFSETFGLIVQSDRNDINAILTRATFTILDNDTPVTPPSGTNYTGDGSNNTWTGTIGTDHASGLDGHDSLYGGASADLIYGGDGNDLIRGGAGSDYLNAGAGVDRVYGDDGDDTINVGPGGRDSLYGGLGYDSLDLNRSDLVAGQQIVFRQGGTFTLSDGTQVSGFERLSITTGSGNDTVTFTNIAADGQSFNAGSGTDHAIVDYSGFSDGITLADRYHFYGYFLDHFAFAGSDQNRYRVNLSGLESIEIVGGSGNDSLGTRNASRVIFHGNSGDDDLRGTTGSDELYGGAGNDSLDSGGGWAETLDGGSGTDYLSLDRSGSTASETAHVDGLLGGTFTLSDGTQVSGFERLNITTGSGNDTVTFTNIAADGQSFNAGSGTDHAIVDYSGFSDGITLADRYHFYGYFLDHFAFAGSDQNRYRVNLSGLESIEIVGGSGNDSLGTRNASRVIFHGNSGDDDLRGTTGSDELYGGAGNDSLDSGGGLAETLDGGSGTDYLNLDRTGSTSNEVIRVDGLVGDAFTLSDGGQVSGIERMHLETGSGDDRATFLNPARDGNTWYGNAGTDRAIIDYSGFSEAVTFSRQSAENFFSGIYTPTSSSWFWANAVYTYGVEEFDITGGSGNDTLEASSTSIALLRGRNGNDLITCGSGNDSLWGDNGNDTISGGIGRDRISGGMGNDVIYGQAGSDTLTGGASTDTFVFDSTLGTTNIDRITDFNPTDDVIWLENAIFTGLADGNLEVSTFRSNLTGQAADADDRIIYETDTGRIFFDIDGAGGTARVHFATLVASLNVTAADFFVI